MKKSYTILLLVILLALELAAQSTQNGSTQAEARNIQRTATATGKTSGHVADLTLTNTTNQIQRLDVGPFSTSSGDRYQPQYIPGTIPTSIPPGSTVKLPLEGYCTDVNLAPPSAGTILIIPEDLGGGSKSPQEDVLQRIIRATESLQQSGQFNTPFSSNPEKERETIIQHTIWVYTSGGSAPYDFNAFCDRIRQMWQKMPNQGANPNPILTQGINQLWSAVVQTGTEADVPGFRIPSLPPSAQTLIPAPASSLPEVTNTIVATGTGRTTGHIANLTLYNPTDHPVIVQFGPGSEPFDGIGKPPLPNPIFIPATGQYQPYLVLYIPPVVLMPGQRLTVPVQGFCTDIHRPPVPDGDGMTPVSQWISVPSQIGGPPAAPEPMNPPQAGGPPAAPEPMNPPGSTTVTMPPNPTEVGGPPAAPEPMNPPQAGGPPAAPEPMNPPGSTTVIVPTQMAMPLNEAVRILLNTKPRPGGGMPAPGQTPLSTLSGVPDCIPVITSSTPNIPGTDSPIPIPIDLNVYPSLAAPLLADAIIRITETYDELKPQGRIKTPFSNNPEKEREAVIQQTFWLYSSALSGENYHKGDFRNNTIRQFEQSTRKPVEQIPKPQMDKIELGVDDFWNTFEAVGAEAKVLKVPPMFPNLPDEQDFWNDYDSGSAKMFPSPEPKGTSPSQEQQTGKGMNNPPELIKDDKNKKESCACGDIEFTLEIWELRQKTDGSFEGIQPPITKTVSVKSGSSLPAHVIKGGKKGLKKDDRISLKLRKIQAGCPCTNGSACIVFKDANEARTKATATAKAEAQIKQKEAALAKAREALEKATQELAGNQRKQTQLQEAKEKLETAQNNLKEALEANERFAQAEQAYNDAKEKTKIAKGKAEKDAAKAAEKVAKEAYDAAKEGKKSNGEIQSLERAVKSAQDKVDSIEKDVKEARELVDTLNIELEALKKEVAENASGRPVLKGEDGKDVEIFWDSNQSEFQKIKEAGKSMEFKFSLNFYCQENGCSPISCNRSFVVKVEEEE